MEMFDIIKQPLFWGLSGIVSVILSVVANLLTPYISRQLISNKQLRRRKGLDEKIALRKQVLMFQRDHNLRVNAKLDAIYWILRAVLLFIFAILSMQIIAAMRNHQILSILMYFIAALCMARSGEWITHGKSRVKAAFLADEREASIEAFCLQQNCTPASLEAADFAIHWDQKKFGLGLDDIKNANKANPTDSKSCISD